jgi:hypothetical protein
VWCLCDGNIFWSPSSYSKVVTVTGIADVEKSLLSGGTAQQYRLKIPAAAAERYIDRGHISFFFGCFSVVGLWCHLAVAAKGVRGAVAAPTKGLG